MKDFTNKNTCLSIDFDEMATKVRNFIDQLSDEDAYELNNSWADETGHLDDWIYKFYELDDQLSADSPREILSRVVKDKFSTADEYWKYDGNGNIVSTSDVYEFVPKWDIAYDAVENYRSFGNDDLKELLDEFYQAEFEVSNIVYDNDEDSLTIENADKNIIVGPIDLYDFGYLEGEKQDMAVREAISEEIYAQTGLYPKDNKSFNYDVFG